MKKNKESLLSICIPTYNRRYALKYTLKSIIEQDEFKSGDVEIVISDNVSTDETEIEVKKLCNKYKNIRYFKNNENIGSNPNINKVLSLGEGEYLWLLGSDDLILPGGLRYTLNVIYKSNPDLILHKQSLCPDCEELFEENYNEKLGFFVFKSQKEYFNYLGDWYNFDVKSFWHIENLQTFMSLICIKKSYYKKCLNSIIKDKTRSIKFNTFYFSQNLLSHFCETDSTIILSDTCYVSSVSIKGNTNAIKQSGYKYTKAIVNDAKLLYNYYYNKYKLDDNFKKLSKRSNQYWNLCIIYGFLGNIFGKGFVKFLSNVYHKIFG